jgi:hypothetical protein
MALLCSLPGWDSADVNAHASTSAHFPPPPLPTCNKKNTGALGVVKGDAGEHSVIALVAFIQVQQDPQLGARAQGG